MPYNPEKQTKLYYNIGEVADMIGVTESLLRFWEKEFKQIHPRKSARNVRQYTKEDIEQIRTIYHLVKEKGLTLDGARQALRNGNDGSSRVAEAIDRLQQIREELVSIRKELDGIV